MKTNILNAIENRRSFYDISNESTLKDEEIENLLHIVTKHTPSAFNSQSARIVLLLNEQHTKLWNIVKETLRTIVPAESFASTKQKVDSFSKGYGTVLFFEDQEVVEALQKQFPLYADNFPIWSNHSAGMHQYLLWLLIEEAGMGASLQHYNPLIDNEVHKTWNLPKSWKLLAQMPFGTPTSMPGEKKFLPLEDRIRVFK